jgi:hypothetical protein
MALAWKNEKEGVHAKNNQEGSADNAQVGKDLENTAKSLPFKVEKITHNLEYGQSLRTVASQGTGNKSRKADSEVGCTTHLAIHWIRYVKINEVKNYGDKKG